MKITFLSNILNHYQLPFCLAMYEKFGNNFKFIATTAIPQERLALGFRDTNKQYSFVLTTYDSDANKEVAFKLALESDVLIIGGSPELLIFDKERRRQNKLTFRFFERICKKGTYTLLLPPRLFSVLKRYVVYGNKNLYILCVSAYTAGDFALLGAYKGKTYKWGYFPEVKKINIQELVQYKKA